MVHRFDVDPRRVDVRRLDPVRAELYKKVAAGPKWDAITLAASIFTLGLVAYWQADRVYDGKPSIFYGFKQSFRQVLDAFYGVDPDVRPSDKKQG